MKYVVYTEIWNENGTTTNWYYGRYDEHKANEVALELGNDSNTYHKVCAETDVHRLNIKNLPASLLQAGMATKREESI